MPRFYELFDNVSNEWINIFLRSELNTNFNIIENDILSLPNIIPRADLIFESLRYFNPHSTKCIIILQEPYSLKELANGLAMGWQYDIRRARNSFYGSTLINFLKAAERGGIKINYTEFDFSLKTFAKGGVLLLNSSLTTTAEKSKHNKYWKPVVAKLLEFLTLNVDNLLILMLGEDAKKLSSSIKNKTNHVVYKHPHPSSSNVSGIKELSQSEFFKELVIRGIELR